MNDIIQEPLRVGNFTSSKIVNLTKMNKAGTDFGVAAKTYIDQKRRERKLKRSIETGGGSRDTAWGNFLEPRVFNLLGLEYRIRANDTVHHPTIEGWAGSADLIIPNVKVSDIKCFAPDKFSKYAEALAKKDTEVLKKDFSTEYWQLVSNAAINQVPNAEVVLYSPYISELEEIQEDAINYDGDEPWKYRFIYESDWWELAVIPDDSDYKNLNVWEFEVPKEDTEYLTELVIKANELIK